MTVGLAWTANHKEWMGSLIEERELDGEVMRRRVTGEQTMFDDNEDGDRPSDVGGELDALAD